MPPKLNYHNAESISEIQESISEMQNQSKGYQAPNFKHQTEFEKEFNKVMQSAKSTLNRTKGVKSLVDEIDVLSIELYHAVNLGADAVGTRLGEGDSAQKKATQTVTLVDYLQVILERLREITLTVNATNDIITG